MVPCGLNLHRMVGYNPAKPLVMKKIWLDGLKACEVLFFVDDGQIIGPAEMLARLVERQMTA
jgi:hypothetical protein